MMELRVTHETRYDYTPVVDTAQHIVYLEPSDTDTQTVVSHTLLIEPSPAQRDVSTDLYGNHRCFFSLQTPHKQLRVVAHSVVRTQVPAPVHSTVAWEQVRDSFRYHSGAPWNPATEFSFGSTHATAHDEFLDYARPSFAPGVSALAAAQDLMQRIHTDFRYEAHSTEINTPTREALHQRKGVCQDFAHIMLACLRSMGLAARYVSGYLLTQPPPGQPRLIGSDASHAWVSLYVPDLPGAEHGRGWYDLDPTNNRDGWGSPGEDYVSVATGRDFSDISPMRGVIHGGGQHTLSVAVTVSPLHEAKTPAP